ncbi:MAG: efflux RND transporter periplasmic adaptor subunit [Algoriphagus sp.]|uniref:efflux RND transporter periplasmic adaptor subunit n=1 Tax=Algoriphagus sp. TaxID=1872435 RepID=UPI00262820AC|nr:efflux RND transporter periplasmic adaptor subunit [Algoriphagus sp.]MDG1277787.1 efflux RND transporter periplasmic adaptor subunit [Algoriphagus sp.]
MKTKSIYFRYFLAPLTLLVAFSCGQNSGDNSGLEIGDSSADNGTIQLNTEQFSSSSMAWGKLEKSEFSEDITVQGAIRVPVENMIDVTTYYGGYVTGLELLEGQSVKKGEVLFYLENPEFILLQQNYLEAKSQLNYLKSEYDRQKTLFDEQIASQKSYLKAEADYQSTRAKAESLKRQLGLLRINADQLQPESIRSKIAIYSPIAGFVTEINAVPGAYVQPTDVPVRLISREHLHIELMIFEKDATAIKKGQTVEVRVPELSSEIFIAEVFMVGQSINDARQINVHADFKDESKESLLVPGMFVEGKIQKDPQEAISVPQTAVIESEGKMYVLVLREKNQAGFSLEKVEVETGRMVDGKIELLPNAKLSETDQILIKGGFNLI